MKKITLLLLAFVYAQLAAGAGYSIVNNWRWKKDEGGITSTEWKAPLNSTAVVSNDSALRLRQMIIISESAWTLNSALTLQYSDEPQTNTTAGKWQKVPLKSEEAASSAPFIIEDDYVGTGTSTEYANTNFAAGDMQIAARSRSQNSNNHTHRGGGIFASTNSSGLGSGSGNPGEWEVEYRIKPTANAVPGKVYYFRVSTAAHGTPDSEDYDTGYPSIAISKDYLGALNADLPDLAVTIPIGSGSYTTGVLRNGVLRIANTGSVSATGPIKVNLSAPSGWTLDIPSPPVDWTYSAGVLSTTTATIPAGSSQNFSYSLVNNTAGFAASFMKATIDKTTTLDGDGSNNVVSSLVYKAN